MFLCFVFRLFSHSLCLLLLSFSFVSSLSLSRLCFISLYFLFVVVLFLCIPLTHSLPLSHSLSHPLFSLVCVRVCARVFLSGNHVLIKQDPGDQLNHHPDDPATLAASNWPRAMRPTRVWPPIPSRSWTGAWISWRPYKHIAVSPTWRR